MLIQVNHCKLNACRTFTCCGRTLFAKFQLICFRLHSDKAGGYGIQHIGSVLVERIDGDFFTVMGLPLYQLSQKLATLYTQYQ